jgi:hypothetical protein
MNKRLLTATAALVIILATLSYGLIYQQIEIQNLKTNQPSLSPKPSTTEEFPSPTTTTVLSPTIQVSLTPTPSSILTPTPNLTFIPPQNSALPFVQIMPSSATLVADVNFASKRVTPTDGGDVLIISGTVTNNGSNTVYNVGFHAKANAVVFGPTISVIDVTVPLNSGTYFAWEQYLLSHIDPHQSIPVNITILPNYQSQEPMFLNVDVILVWSMSP